MNLKKRQRDFKPYAVGNVIYGSGRSAPNIGMRLDPMGYKVRELKASVRKAAARRVLEAQKKKNYNAPDWLREKG